MRAESRVDCMTDAGIVLWGTLAEHGMHRRRNEEPTILVVTDFFDAKPELIAELKNQRLDAEIWISEENLRQWDDEDICWPTAAMVAASGDANHLHSVARWYGAQLRSKGINGIFGTTKGILSHLSLPWLGDSLCRIAESGFRHGGIRAAWVINADSHGTHWILDGGEVLPWPLQDALRAPWYWAHVKDLRQSSFGVLDPLSIPERDSVKTILNHMRDSSIHLVDDPDILPYPAHSRFFVHCADIRVKIRAEHGLNSTIDDGGPVVPVWIDDKPEAIDYNGVVVGYKNSAVIGLSPPRTVKVQVFDDYPTVWTALRAKLVGESSWFGRTPFRLDQPQLATHASHYGTEQPNPDLSLRWIDAQPLHEVMQRWITSEQQALEQIRPAVPTLEKIVWRLVECYRSGAKIFYVGAGSAGRAGMMDAVELPPTFGIDPSRVQAILAGGLSAFEKAQEGEEDDFAGGQKRIVLADIQPGDVVLGISAHGNTPFVLGALTEARNRGCYTVALVNNLGTQIADVADEVVFVDSGPEILLGSTRLKAGTIEKVVLNLLSTLMMVKMGRSYDNLMIDFTATNEKLRERAIRVFMIATGQPRKVAQKTLCEAHGKLSVAIVMQMCGLSVFAAQEALHRNETVAEVLSRRRGEENIIHGSWS